MGHDAASFIDVRVDLVQILFSRPQRLESSWKSPAFLCPSTFVRSTLEERTSPGASTYFPLSPFRVFHFSGFLVVDSACSVVHYLVFSLSVATCLPLRSSRYSGDSLSLYPRLLPPRSSG